MIEKLNLLFTVNIKWCNAEATYALNLARAFQQHGHHVLILVNPNSSIEEKAKKQKLNTINSVLMDSINPFQIYKNYKLLRCLILENEIHIVNSFKSNGSFLFHRLRKKNPILKYFKTRGEARPPKNNWLNRYLYSKHSCDGVIVPGKLVKNWIISILPLHQEIKIIYYGDSPEDIGRKVYSKDLKEKLGLKTDRLTFALIGRAQDVKGHMHLLHAYLALKKPRPNLLLLVKDLEEYPEKIKQIRAYMRENCFSSIIFILKFGYHGISHSKERYKSL